MVGTMPQLAGGPAKYDLRGRTLSGRLIINKGNSKLRAASKDARPGARRRRQRVFNFNQRAFDDCPGFSEWCVENCYVPKGMFSFWAERYRENSRIAHETGRLVEEVELLPKGAWVRIHASGDFDSVDYIRKWIVAATVRPDIRFWAYTRSWRIPELRRSLDVLRGLPNVVVFASMDPSIDELPPEGWRAAWISDDSRAKGLVCPEQAGTKSDCVDCGFCVLSTNGDLTLITH